MRFDAVVSRVSDISYLKPATKKAGEQRLKAKVYVLSGVRVPATIIVRQENSLALGDRVTVSIKNLQTKLVAEENPAPTPAEAVKSF
jgi:hypothetical protein